MEHPESTPDKSPDQPMREQSLVNTDARESETASAFSSSFRALFSGHEAEQLLVAFSQENPGGENLEYAPEFAALEIELSGKPEVQYGETITPAQPPEWKIVRRTAFTLLQRSRDLRVAVPYCRSLLKLEGVAGFAIGVALVNFMLSTLWDCLHPQLDPDDDLDPTARVNTLNDFAQDADITRDLLSLPVVPGKPKDGVPVTFGDIEIATGVRVAGKPAAESADQAAVAAFRSESALEAELGDTEIDVLTRHAALIETAADDLVRIEDRVTQYVGNARAIDLAFIVGRLRRGAAFLRRHIADRQGSGAAPGPDNEGNGGGGDGDIRTRADVIRMIDRIAAYYVRFEPSSPVPLLLMRAQRLVSKSFVEIIEDLVPDGLKEVNHYAGIQPIPQDD